MANTRKFRFFVIAGLVIFGTLVASSVATTADARLVVENASGYSLYLTFTVDGTKQDREAIANGETKEVKGDDKLAACIQIGPTNIGYVRVKFDKKKTVWWSTTRLEWDDFQDRKDDFFEIKKLEGQSGKNKKTIKVVGGTWVSAGNARPVVCK